MATIKLELTGIAAELSLGNYMPTDPTIMNNWEDFYRYNDLIHTSELLADHISNIKITVDNQMVYTGKIPASHFTIQKSYMPALVHRALYLRTECAEQAVFECVFEAEKFDNSRLFFETQDYDLLFKVGTAFVTSVKYDGKDINLEWKSAKPLGNICLLCRFDNGFLVPIYDAIKKLEAIN